LRLATTVVLESLIVVETKDASSVVDKNKTKYVTANIKSLKKNNRDEINYHREVHRIWGTYDRLHAAGCFFLKRTVF
jgi:mannose-1-phosphate guanylyltransferase